MASSSVEEELECPICTEFLRDPVTLDCGHNFCRSCITDYCEKWEDLGDLECPLCKAKIKKGNFRPNFSLANIVEKIKLLSLNPGKEDLCLKHKERLHLFCKEDKELLCLFCERSPEHRSHTVFLLDEAAKEYKARFQDHLRILVIEQERILEMKIAAKKESQDLLKQVKMERKKAVTEFRQLQQFLQEQENLLLAQMEEVMEQIIAKREEHLARLSEEQSSLESLIQEMQEKLHHPTGELLKDVGSTLQKYKTRTTLEKLEAFPDRLKYRSRKFSYINHFMQNEIKKLKESLQSELQQNNASIALGPDSAHFEFLLPEGHKNMRQAKKCVFLQGHQMRKPLYAELQLLSREDTVRRKEYTSEWLSRKENSEWITIDGSDSDYEDLS
ncbi:tripartite motif-containing protein 10-like [Tiliqua scincoides]|uniref:tripartite motif-containing protein 10-like n=1 Tax=Tiliqua scincoides TaxID=71010 RepID=UPI003461FBDA